MAHPERGRFQRAGLLAFVGLFSLLCMFFVPTLGDEPDPSTLPAMPDRSYRLVAGDAVRINVHHGVDLTLEARIGTTGWISHPALGNVKIGGMTVSAAEAQIAAGWTGPVILGIPTVTVLVIDAVGSKTSAAQRPSQSDELHLRAAVTGLATTRSREGRKALSQTLAAALMIAGPQRHFERSTHFSLSQERRP